jgi:transposase-like protein
MFMLMPTKKSEDAVPPTEVSSKAKRRSFTAKYKLRIVVEADQCSKRGDVGALLRREGLYSSHLTDWRKARAAGELEGPTKRRGPKPRERDQLDVRKIAKLEREVARLERRAERAEAIVDLQKKVAELLGDPFTDPSDKS